MLKQSHKSNSHFTIIIDGHNLVFYLFNFPSNQRLSQEIAQNLVSHLSVYQKSFTSTNLIIEICFDGGVHPPSPDPEGIRVLAAGPRNNADNLILDRFRFHSYSDRPCLVITNDGEIQEKLEQEGGVYLNVYDFVLLPHPTHPVFLSPEDLPLDPSEFNGQPHPTSNPDKNKNLLEDNIGQFGRLKPAQARKKDHNLINTHRLKPYLPEKATELIISPEEETVFSPQEKTSSTHYTLTVNKWPVAAGVRFLLASFCSKHRPQFINLLDSFDLSQLRPSDVVILAEFLRNTCSTEPEFSHRGSLMDRVRLALLKSGDAGLDLETLAVEIGVKPEGLQGRIKRKANGWLVISTLPQA